MTNDGNEETIIVTEEGLAEMQRELEERQAKQMEIAAEIDEARRLGDLRENEPYQNAMTKKEINDARIEKLEFLLLNAQVVEKGKAGLIGIGSTAVIKNQTTNIVKEFLLVGKEASQESDPRGGKISVDSPIGNAMLGKKKGDRIAVQLPSGTVEYTVEEVK
jgi:transcription elongation factor GreA